VQSVTQIQFSWNSAANSWISLGNVTENINVFLSIYKEIQQIYANVYTYIINVNVILLRWSVVRFFNHKQTGSEIRRTRKASCQHNRISSTFMFSQDQIGVRSELETFNNLYKKWCKKSHLGNNSILLTYTKIGGTGK